MARYLSRIALFHQPNYKKFGIALVLSNDGDKQTRSYTSLDAISLITTHGFLALDIERIDASKHTALAGWQNRLEFFRFNLEGVHRNEF